MERLCHEHPLQLVDLQPNYPFFEEEYDDDDDDDEEEEEEEEEKDNLNTNWDFHHPCNRCGREIKWYDRFYYKCSKGSCDYFLHKFCGEMPTTLKHRSHRALDHTLTVCIVKYRECYVCLKSERDRLGNDIYYQCLECSFRIHVRCALAQEENHPIYHPSHPHPLVSVTSEPILCMCDACGKKHIGIFYHCTTCRLLSIHSDCAFLPKKLPLPTSQHTHPLTLCYSFPEVDQEAKLFPMCRICGRTFYFEENLWIYSCEKCRYYAHLDCATSREEPFMSIFYPPRQGIGKFVKNFEDADHPGLLNLPFPDQTYDILQQVLLSKENGHGTITTNECNLNHIGHQHMLTIQSHDPSSSSVDSMLSCHNPMKKTELLCNGCIRPITNMPFYKCTKQNEGCSFVVHVWCTQLPTELVDYPGHPDHTLIFLPNVPNARFELINVFRCSVCELRCNGFAYGCVKCKYYIDVTCGFIPEKITHEAHSGHLLSRVSGSANRIFYTGCIACRREEHNTFAFGCRGCDFYLHPECALLMPSSITHRLDKHPLQLKYLPVENHKGQYFCTVCEKELDPKRWFYHCDMCVQSIHPMCSSLITECERAMKTTHFSYVFEFLNIKFGGTYNIEGHPHSLSFAQGINYRDGKYCSSSWCFEELQNKMIFKCFKCKFVIHYKCMYKLSRHPPRQPLLLNN